MNISDVDTGALLRSVGDISPYLGENMEMFFSPDGRYVSVRYWDNVLRVWRVADGECVVSESTGDMIEFGHFSREGKVLVSGSLEKTLDAFRIIEL